MKKYKTLGHIKSLDGKLCEITILQEYKILNIVIKNQYICKFRKIKCLAIYNPNNKKFYVDDINSLL